MISYFLAKTDPETYSIKDLKKEKETNWDGVRSHQAVQVIQSWKPGDIVVIYHSQKETKIVGVAEVTGLPEKDLSDIKGISWYAKVKFLKELPKENQITLQEIKLTGLFNDFALVRQGRLSTMACPENFVVWLKEKGVL